MGLFFRQFPEPVGIRAEGLAAQDQPVRVLSQVALIAEDAIVVSRPNAIPSWSWRGCAGKSANVEVYARAHSVELLVNGKSAGKKELKNDCMAKFRSTYEDGTVEAVSYDSHGQELGRCSLRTASPETQPI